MYLPGEIHERIKDLRLNKGLSQKDLCNITGIVPSQLSRIENGKIDDISNDTLIKLSKKIIEYLKKTEPNEQNKQYFSLNQYIQLK